MLCRIVIIGFAVLWFLSLVILAIGTFGWFGQEQDPLSGVYVVLLGSPWIQFIGSAGMASPLVGIVAPVVNLLCLVLACRIFGSRN
jgi:hypothetical protein